MEGKKKKIPFRTSRTEEGNFSCFFAEPAFSQITCIQIVPLDKKYIFNKTMFSIRQNVQDQASSELLHSQVEQQDAEKRSV